MNTAHDTAGRFAPAGQLTTQAITITESAGNDGDAIWTAAVPVEVHGITYQLQLLAITPRVIEAAAAQLGHDRTRVAMDVPDFHDDAVTAVRERAQQAVRDDA